MPLMFSVSYNQCIQVDLDLGDLNSFFMTLSSLTFLFIPLVVNPVIETFQNQTYLSFSLLLRRESSPIEQNTLHIIT